MNPRDTRSELQKLKEARNFGKGAREQLNDQIIEDETDTNGYTYSDDDNDFIVEEPSTKILKRARPNTNLYAEPDDKYTPVRNNKNQTFAMIQPKVESTLMSGAGQKSLFQHGDTLMDEMLDQIMDESEEDN